MSKESPSRIDPIIIWLVASASAAEAFLQVVDYWLDGNVPKLALWLAGAAGIFALGSIIERINQQRSETP